MRNLLDYLRSLSAATPAPLHVASHEFSHAGRSVTLPILSTPTQLPREGFANCFVYLTVSGDDVFLTHDGTAPSSTNGARVSNGWANYFKAGDAMRMMFVCPNGAASIYACGCDYLP